MIRNKYLLEKTLHVIPSVISLIRFYNDFILLPKQRRGQEPSKGWCSDLHVPQNTLSKHVDTKVIPFRTELKFTKLLY